MHQVIEDLDLAGFAVLVGGYLALIGTSGLLVNGILSRISKEPISQRVSKEARDTGFVVGKCENLLILTFMLLDAYTALALVFAAKAIVRREDMSKNSLFFLAGTMINVTYSIMIGLAMKTLIEIV
ncbi:MAG: hypothetical protein E3J35_09595 [Methanomassiliicoccales archaeon]|nr:MAG: hypothetical protein E3J35_09595 [Methanomassiliicoccales archaeon]